VPVPFWVFFFSIAVQFNFLKEMDGASQGGKFRGLGYVMSTL
jgi:hypothetical protein